MDVVRIDERDVDWARLSECVESGAKVEVMRGEQVLATVTSGGPTGPERKAPHPSWKAAGVDWDEIRRFRDGLTYDPTNSVVEMRKQARY